MRLDGEEPTILQTGLDNPNGIFTSNDDLNIFIVDSHFKTRKKENIFYPGIDRNGSIYHIYWKNNKRHTVELKVASGEMEELVVGDHTVNPGV